MPPSVNKDGSFYLIGRGSLDFQRLYELDQSGAFIVARARKGFNFRRRYLHPIDRSTGFICDQTILLTGYFLRKNTPNPFGGSVTAMRRRRKRSFS